MNSCILMVEVISEPELRQTTDNLEVANMMVEFPGLRSEDPSARIRAVGWGNLAKDISDKYHTGDRVIIEGRLGMNTIEMKEGYKEKRAELVISRIFPVGSSNTSSYTSPAPSEPSNVVDFQSPAPAPTPAPAPVASAAKPVEIPDAPAPGNYTNEELDDIPFMKPIYSKNSMGKVLCDSWELTVDSYWNKIK